MNTTFAPDICLRWFGLRLAILLYSRGREIIIKTKGGVCSPKPDVGKMNAATTFKYLLGRCNARIYMYITNTGRPPTTATKTATLPTLPLSMAAPPLNVLDMVEFAAAETAALLVWAGETPMLDVPVVRTGRDDNAACVDSAERVISLVIADFEMVLVIVLLFDTN